MHAADRSALIRGKKTYGNTPRIGALLSAAEKGMQKYGELLTAAEKDMWKRIDAFVSAAEREVWKYAADGSAPIRGR